VTDRADLIGRALVQVRDRAIDVAIARAGQREANSGEAVQTAVQDAADYAIFGLLELLQRGIPPMVVRVEVDPGVESDFVDFFFAEAGAEASALYGSWVESFSGHDRGTI
jgi:hypothetical protein